MLTTTDVVIGTLVLIYFIDGLRKGTFRSLITPLSFLVSLIIGILNFDLNENLFTAITITLVGTTILSLCIKSLLLFSHRTVDKKHRNYASWISRLTGGIISFFWKGTITGLLLLLFASLPPTTEGMQELQKNIRLSQAYDLAKQHLAQPGTPVWNVLASLQVLQDPGKLDALSKTSEVQGILLSPKATSMVNDPAVTSAMQRGDYIQLLNNPRVIALLNDDQIMYQVTKIAKRLYAETRATITPPAPPP